MAVRSYSSYSNLKACAARIVSECITEGCSTGWSGTEEALDKLVEICGKFGVEYVDDFRGEWAPKNA